MCIFQIILIFGESYSGTKSSRFSIDRFELLFERNKQTNGRACAATSSEWISVWRRLSECMTLYGFLERHDIEKAKELFSQQLERAISL